MAIRKIVTMGDEVLRKKSRPVVNFNEKLWQLLDDMKDTMNKAEGVGLAAVQVGVLRRVIVIDVGDGLMELINPEIIETSGEQEGQEGCLSIPGRWGVTRRPMHVTVRALNRQGESFDITGTGLLAKAFCHELDHLDGKLYIDCAIRMSDNN